MDELDLTDYESESSSETQNLSENQVSSGQTQPTQPQPELESSP